MEIRNVVNEVKNEYPKMKQVSQKRLLDSIPKKWLKVGLSSLGITMIMKKNVFALSLEELNSMDMEIAGACPAPVPVPLPIRTCDVTCHIVQIVSAIVFIITGLSIIIIKQKAKKQDVSKKVPKVMKFIFVTSIIVFILSIFAKYIVNIIY